MLYQLFSTKFKCRKALFIIFKNIKDILLRDIKNDVSEFIKMKLKKKNKTTQQRRISNSLQLDSNPEQLSS